MPTEHEELQASLSSNKPVLKLERKEESERELPIEMVARALGAPYWTSIPASATGMGFEGPGWLLAGVMAGNKLGAEHPISKSKLLELGEEAASHSIGHSAHPKKKG